jgi:CobQ/CobB/MinD/ParA nucleotide binding domain
MPKSLMNDEPQTTHGTAAVHLSLQGKGGVGKSLIASFLAQYYKARGERANCVDTDPVNQTFSQYAALGAQHLQLMDGNQIDRRRFDSLLESILTTDESFIVDNGAATFIPLWHYMVESRVPWSLREANRRLVIHTVITGGQALADTVTGFRSLAESCESRSIVVWINEYFGPVEKDGKKFGQMAAFLENQDKVAGTVLIPRFSPDTFGRDLEDMIARKLTFGEIAWATGFTLMSKQRLRMIERELFEQMDLLNLLEATPSNAD